MLIDDQKYKLKTKNVNKNKTESKMKNFTHSFREMNLVRIKSKTVISWSSRKKKERIFSNK